MSRSADRARTDGGFTLVEIIVALGLLMVVMTALLPQLVVGIRSTSTARVISQAKGVAQGQLDEMRNLPFHVSPAAGDYRDVLDSYYRNLTSGTTPTCMSSGTYAVPQPSWAGYVSAADARCAYEPAGAFYRYIHTLAPSGTSGGFTVVVDTQFLSGATPPQPVTPPTGYNTQTIGKANPASTQIGITATVLYSTRGTVRPISTYTQLAEQPAATTRVRAEGRATTLEVGSVTAANGSVSLSSGLLNLVGSLTYASTVTANLSGTSAGLATGEKSSGASASVAAPPSLSAATITSGSGSLPTGCAVACWGSTRIDLAPMSANQGLPNAGSVSTPMQALLSDSANNGISFGNSATDDYRAGLNLATPLLRVDPNAVPAASGTSAGCTLGGAGTSSYVTASGYLRTTAVTDPTSPSTVESCVVARASTISLFPTDFTPPGRGVVLVELGKASARCLVSGAGHTPSVTSDYEAVVKYFDGSGYTTAATITEASGTDPLDAVNLATTAVGGGKVLGDYIASWSALTTVEIIKTEATGVAELQLPGIVTIASQPVRPGTELLDPTIPTSPLVDATSVVSATVGALRCSAQDLR